MASQSSVKNTRSCQSKTHTRGHESLWVKTTTRREQEKEIFSPDSRVWWWWCAGSGLFVWAAPSWGEFCNTGWDGWAARRESPVAWWWHMSSAEDKRTVFIMNVSITCFPLIVLLNQWNYFNVSYKSICLCQWMFTDAGSDPVHLFWSYKHSL